MTDSYSYPIARVGIVGGGQLGRMLVQAASRIGCSCIILDPSPNSPAGQLADRQIVGDLYDPNCLRALAEACDVITYEIEDIGAETLAELEAEGHRIQPSPALLAVVQDKFEQKTRFIEKGIPTADFKDMPQTSAEANERAFAEFGYPLVQKSRRGGYDGRGVAIIQTAEQFSNHLPVASFVERFIDADKELAVVVARGQDGACQAYPVVEMVFSGENILDLLLAPAEVSDELAKAAEALAIQTVEALDGVGVFGVELFLTHEGALLVNEVAPRTHNSGHHTIEACETDQFEQHLRAVVGLPLGSTKQLSPAAMLNLLGGEGCGQLNIEGLTATLAIPGASVHLYGKAETRPHRKMGHVTLLAETIEAARIKAEQVRTLLKISGETL